MSSLLFPVYKTGRENTQPKKVSDFVFEKAECRVENTECGMSWRNVALNRTRDYTKAALRRIFLKRCYDLAKFTRKHLCRNLQQFFFTMRFTSTNTHKGSSRQFSFPTGAAKSKYACICVHAYVDLVALLFLR